MEQLDIFGEWAMPHPVRLTSLFALLLRGKGKQTFPDQEP
jgi:hypothetical protein